MWKIRIFFCHNLLPHPSFFVTETVTEITLFIQTSAFFMRFILQYFYYICCIVLV